MIFKSILLLFLLLTTAVSSINNLFTLTILVKQNNVDLLRNELYEISNPESDRYGDYYTKMEIDNLVEPNQMDKKTVINWMNDNNFIDN